MIANICSKTIDIEHIFDYNFNRTNVRKDGGEIMNYQISMQKRQKRRRRQLSSFSYILLSLLCLTIMLLCGPWNSDTAEAQTADNFSSMKPIMVQSGDTLWQLVAEHCYYQGDIRRAIYDVKQMNGLKSADIYPGQILYMPTKELEYF